MSLPFDEIRRMRGLVTNPNPLTAPDGAMLVADNAEIPAEDVVCARRGYRDFSSNLPNALPKQLFEFAGTLYAHIDNALWQHDGASWQRLAGYAGGGTTNFGGAVYTGGALYVCAIDDHAILKFDLSTGTRTVFAGRIGVSGTTNGTAGAARFNVPTGICTDGTNLFVSDQNGHLIRKIVIATAVVTTLAGSSSGSADSYYIPAAAQWSQSDASSSANWGSVAFSSTLGSGSGRLCAIETGTATTSAMTSDDGGATWTARTLPSSRSWMSVTWAAGLSLFVAVAQDGTTGGLCATSPDGITWTSRTMPSGAWASVAWSSTLSRLVAVGLSAGPNYACTSTDGITWTTSGVTQINGYWVSVCAAGSLGFCAVGQFDTGSGQVMYASTGLNWTAGTVTAANQWMSVTYSSTLNRLVAVSQDGATRTMYSADGSSWTGAAASAANLWSGVTWSDAFNAFIAVSQDGANRIMYSTTGTGGWTAVAAPDTNQWYAIVDAPLIGRVVSTALGVLDAVMRATTSGAALGGGTFNTPIGVATDATYVYVCDSANHTIRKVSIATGAVSTVAGSAGNTGTTNGTGTAARFNTPWGLALVSGNLYVADLANNRIRQVVASTGVVTTLAGSGSAANTDATGTSAAFNLPGMLCAGPGGTDLYVSHTANARIRKIVISSGVVTTPSTTAGVAGGLTTDGVDLFLATEATIYKVYLESWLETYLHGSLETAGNLLGINHASGMVVGPDTGRRVRAAEIAECALVTSNRGVLKIIDADSEILPAGMPRALDLIAELDSSAATEVLLANGEQTAYRMRWGRRHAGGRVVFGPPSGRVPINNNAGATRDVLLTAYIPTEITSSDFFEIYRETIGTETPGDEVQKIYERAPTTAEILQGWLQVLDTTPDIFRGAKLDTNESQAGPGQSNDRPPHCVDISEQKGVALYLNTKLPQRKLIQLLGVGGLTAATSTITIGGVTLTADTAETIASGVFKKFTTGTDSQNTENTARSLCKVFNLYAANTKYYAYYASGVSDPPGRILIEARSFGEDAFAITANSAGTGGAFNPVLPTSGTEVQSSDEARRNRLYASKRGQPEHVPWGENFYDIGSESDEAHRIIRHGECNFVFKDKTIWRVLGDSPENIVVVPHDDTVELVGRDTVVRCNGQLFALTNQGVVSVEGSGVTIVSWPIERDLLADVRASIAAGTQHDWVAVGHDSDRTLRLWGPTFTYGDDAGKRVCWKYNVLTKAWTRELTNANCAAVFRDRVYYGLNNAYGHVLKQRSGFADASASFGSEIEQTDPSGSVVLSGVSGATATYTFTDGVNWDGYYSTFGAGWLVVDGSNWFVVESVAGGVVTFDRSGITSGTKTAYRPIPFAVEFAPRTAGSSFSEKQKDELHIVADTQNSHKCTVSFVNETDTKAELTDQAWTSSPPSHVLSLDAFEGSSAQCRVARRYRTDVLRSRSRGAQVGVRIDHSIAASRFVLRSIGLGTRDTGGKRVER